MFAFKGDYRMQCCISFLAVEIISLCFLWLLIRLNGERFGVWVTWLFANIASVLTDPVSKLAVADAICLFSALHISWLSAFVHCICGSERDGNLGWQRYALWLETTVSCREI